MQLLATCVARPAHAMGLDAVTAVASRLARSLPGSTGWSSAHDALLVLEIDRRADVESLDPERFASLHRVNATRDASGAAAPDVDALDADAIDELLAATSAVSAALVAPDAAALAEPLSRLAQAACDLADPFLATAPDADEAAGARAAFADVFDAASFATVSSSPIEAADLTAAARALAAQSATLREAAEQAATSGDETSLNELRSARLGAALAMARLALVQAAARADAAVPQSVSDRRLSIWPNPARGAVRVAFTLPRPGAARLEVIDVSGRRVIARSLGSRVAGAQSVILEASGVIALPEGTYFVRIHSGDMRLGGRLVRVDR